MTEAKNVVQKPWGKYQVLLVEPYCQVKQITVTPGHRLSYQYHNKRAEHWLVVKGEALVTINNRIKVLKAGESVDIKIRDKHRVACQSKTELVFIEVQTGTYFGEDDIVRIADDYKRN